MNPEDWVGLVHRNQFSGKNKITAQCIEYTTLDLKSIGIQQEKNKLIKMLSAFNATATQAIIFPQ